MSSILYTVAIVAILIALLWWVRRSATRIRERAARREQEAMAMMLATPRVAAEPGGGGPEAAAPAVPTPAEQAAAGMDPIEELISHIEGAPAPRPAPASDDAQAAAPVAAAAAEPRARAESVGTGVPLRELVLAWYESRGYRASPASAAVWPIERVLRHRDDAARAYAFVVQPDLVSVDRITALVEQAREIGMLRVAVVAEAGYERGARDVARRQHVRLIDREAMVAELAALNLATAAKIVAVARTRAEASAASA